MRDDPFVSEFADVIDRDDQTPCFTVPAIAVEELLRVVRLPAR